VSEAAGRLESINLSPGGLPKLPVPEAVVTAGGLAGDRQRDLRYHGGRDRAVTLFALERIAGLRREGHPVVPGAVGENLTVSGLDWERLVPGTRLRVGPVLLEVTRYTTPCAKLAGCFHDGRVERVAQRLHPGWSRLCARVLEEGRIRVGDPVRVDAAVAPIR